MNQTASRFLFGLAVTAAAGCTVPGGPHIGGGPLPLSTLAITSIDPETGNASHKVALEWPPALNAKTYEVQRKFGDNTTRVIASVNTDAYVDTTVGADQTFIYSIRALSGENKELVVSNPLTVKVLSASVAKPTGLAPADNATVNVGENPTFSWQPVTGANWYYVKVVTGENTVWSALTSATSIQFGADSAVKFEGFADQFPVGTQSSITRDVVYRWTVSAIRGDATDVKMLKAVDVNPSATLKFSQGG